MTTRYIDIEDGQLVPKSLTAYLNDTVIFRMSGRTDKVTVDFGTSSPFGSQPDDLKFDLDGGNQQNSSSQKTVTASTAHQYFYNVNHVPPPEAEPEPTTTLPGDITVSTEPPPKGKL